jgi:hypothetical protein
MPLLIRLLEPMLVSLHVNAAARKYNALLFQPQALFEGRVSAEQNAPVGADHSMPGDVR